MSKNRMYQGGSLGSYIVVGALLVLLLVGGLYTVGRIDDDSGQIATDTSNNTEDNGTSTDNNTDSDTNKNTDSTKDDTPVSSDDNNDNTSTDDTNSSDTSGNNPEELPATGASETFAAATILGLVTYAGTLYIASRRA